LRGDALLNTIGAALERASAESIPKTKKFLFAKAVVWTDKRGLGVVMEEPEASAAVLVNGDFNGVMVRADPPRIEEMKGVDEGGRSEGRKAFEGLRWRRSRRRRVEKMHCLM
jgi:hypothetical protein